MYCKSGLLFCVEKRFKAKQISPHKSAREFGCAANDGFVNKTDLVKYNIPRYNHIT